MTDWKEEWRYTNKDRGNEEERGQQERKDCSTINIRVNITKGPSDRLNI